MRNHVTAAAILLATAFTSVSAQTITITPGRDDARNVANPSSGKREALRVTVNLQSMLPIALGANADEQMRAGEEVRRKLYEATARECAVLQDVYKADCKLAQIGVTSSVIERGNMGFVLNTNSNATYELLLIDRRAQP